METIGNKLEHFLKISKETLKGKYTSFARIYVEIDLSGALPEAIILEVYDEEWVQTIDYKHIPFRCCKCHQHGHLFRDYLTKKVESNGKTSVDKDHEAFTKVGSKGKGGKRSQKKTSEDRQTKHNSFKILEDMEESMEITQDKENVPKE